MSGTRSSELLEQRCLPAIITVTTLKDVVNATDGLMSLREAITLANSSLEDDEILLPSGTLKISRSGRYENENLQGDFDLIGNLTIRGAGSDHTIVDARHLDRAFHVFGSSSGVANVILAGLSIRHGSTRVGEIGGGILVEGTPGEPAHLQLMQVELTRNSSREHGGALAAQHAIVTLDQCTVSENRSSKDGGGTWTTESEVMLTSSTVSSNRAGEHGGGLSADKLALLNSTVSGNRAARQGGGVFVTEEFLGDHLTVTGNNAREGGGLLATGDMAVLQDSIVARNSAISTARGPDVRGDFTSLGHNLIGINNGASASFPRDNVIGDLVGTSNRPLNPKLGFLADNGGLTKTHRLKTGSPAIDAATNRDAAVWDQRGLPRGVDGNRDGNSLSDIGAFELILEGVSDSVRIGSPSITFQQLHQDVLINADYWDLQPKILAAGLGFTDTIGLPGLMSSNLSVQERAVRRAGGGWSDIANPDADIRARTAAASPLAVAVGYGWPVLFRDGFPIEFSWPVRPSTVTATDFVVTLNTGERVQPQVASVNPNFEFNERSTVVIFGSFGNRLPPTAAGAVYPVKFEVIEDDSPLQLIGPAGVLASAVGFSFGDGSTPLTPYQANSGPTLVAAKLSRMSNAGEGGPPVFNGQMPNDGLALYGDAAQYRLRILTTGGFSPDGIRSVLPTEFARYFRLRAVADTGEIVWLTETNVPYAINGATVTVLGLAELGIKQDQYDDSYIEDHDNQIDIVLTGDKSAMRAITHVHIPATGEYTPFQNPGGPGNDPSPGVIYSQPGPTTLQPVTIALDDPWTVTWSVFNAN